jgi:peptide/nickel transport system permease protein
MRHYAIRRLTFFVPVVILLSIITFVAARSLPGDEALLVLGTNAPPAAVKSFRQEFHLDDPLPSQYLRWLAGVLHGDPGQSMLGGHNIGRELRARLPVTATIMVLSFSFTVIIGVSFGSIAALRQDRLPDYGVRLISVIGLSIPDFFLLTLLLLIPAILWRYAPPFGYIPFWENPLRAAKQFIPPTLLLAFGQAALLMRLTRSALLEVLRSDYVRTASAKGLAARIVFLRHALRNALIPVLTVSGVLISGLLGGSVILENITSLPGLGQYTFEAVTHRDYNVIMTMTLYAALVVMTMNLVVDLLYGALDPRIRYR